MHYVFVVVTNKILSRGTIWLNYVIGFDYSAQIRNTEP